MTYGWGNLAQDAGKGVANLFFGKSNVDALSRVFSNQGAAGTNPTPTYAPQYADRWAADNTYSYWQGASDEEKDAILGARSFGVDQNDGRTIDILGKYGFDSRGQHASEFQAQQRPAARPEAESDFYSRDQNTSLPNTAVRTNPGEQLPAKPSASLVEAAKAGKPVTPFTSTTSRNNSIDQNLWNVNELVKATVAKYGPEYDAARDRILTAKNPYDTGSPEFQKVLAGSRNRVAAMMGQHQAMGEREMAGAGMLGGTKAEEIRFNDMMAGRKAQAENEEGLYRNALNNYVGFEAQRNRDYTNLLGLGMNAEMTGAQAIASTAKEAYTVPMMVQALTIKNQLDQITLDDTSMTADTRRARINAENQAVIDTLPWQTDAQKVQFENAVAQGKIDSGIIKWLSGMEPSLALAIITGSKFMAAAAPAATNVAMSSLTKGGA